MNAAMLQAARSILSDATALKDSEKSLLESSISSGFVALNVLRMLYTYSCKVNTTLTLTSFLADSTITIPALEVKDEAEVSPTALSSDLMSNQQPHQSTTPTSPTGIGGSSQTSGISQFEAAGPRV